MTIPSLAATSVDKLANALIDNVEFIKDLEGGRLKILNNQLIFYKDAELFSLIYQARDSCP